MEPEKIEEHRPCRVGERILIDGHEYVVAEIEGDGLIRFATSASGLRWYRPARFRSAETTSRERAA